MNSFKIGTMDIDYRLAKILLNNNPEVANEIFELGAIYEMVGEGTMVSKKINSMISDKIDSTIYGSFIEKSGVKEPTGIFAGNVQKFKNELNSILDKESMDNIYNSSVDDYSVVLASIVNNDMPTKDEKENYLSKISSDYYLSIKNGGITSKVCFDKKTQEKFIDNIKRAMKGKELKKYTSSSMHM